MFIFAKVAVSKLVWIPHPWALPWFICQGTPVVQQGRGLENSSLKIFPSQLKFDRYFVSSRPNYYLIIAVKLCMCHDRCVAVACAKFVAIQLPAIHIFDRTCNTNEKSPVRWAPGQSSTCGKKLRWCIHVYGNIFISVLTKIMGNPFRFNKIMQIVFFNIRYYMTRYSTAYLAR